MLRCILVVFLWMPALPGLAQSGDGGDTCDILREVAGLPGALNAARQSRAEARDFLIRLKAAQRSIWAAHDVLDGHSGDAATLRAVIGEVQRAWEVRTVQQGTMRTGQAFALTNPLQDRLAGLLAKYGCAPDVAQGQTLVFGFLPFPVVLMIVAFIGLGGVLPAVAFLRLLDQRRSARFVCHLSADLISKNARWAVTVVDVGQNGAKVKRQCEEHLRGSLMLEIGETRLPARVIWTNDTYAGLEFLQVLDEQELARWLNRAETMAAARLRSADA